MNYNRCFLFAVYFDRDMDLMINTSSCKMTWASDYEYPGVVEDRTFNTITEEGIEIKENYQVCKIEFTSSIFIGKMVHVRFSGHRALSLISTHGNIEINSPLNISGFEVSSVISSIGGYVKILDDGVDAGRANMNKLSLIITVRKRESKWRTQAKRSQVLWFTTKFNMIFKLVLGRKFSGKQ